MRDKKQIIKDIENVISKINLRHQYLFKNNLDSVSDLKLLNLHFLKDCYKQELKNC